MNKQQIQTCVVACIRDPQDRVALTRRCIDPFNGQWVMPGGKIDFGESIVTALRREVREEVGIGVEIEGLIGTYEHLGNENGRHYIILYYHCRPQDNQLTPDGRECNEALWVPSQHLGAYELSPGTRTILQQVYGESFA